MYSFVVSSKVDSLSFIESKKEEIFLNKEITIGAVVDLETTGLSPNKHEVIEISILKFLFSKKTGEIVEQLEDFYSLNQPSIPLPSFIRQLTGITDEMLQGHKLDVQQLITFSQYIEYLIAHNASFDRSFMMRLSSFFVEKKWYCSMRHIRWKEYGFTNKKLQTLLDGHNILNDTAHRANSDTKSTLTLLQQLNPKGETYMKEMLLRKPMQKPKIVSNDQQLLPANRPNF